MPFLQGSVQADWPPEDDYFSLALGARAGRAGYLLREIVDEWFLVYRIEDEHCKKSYERETAFKPR